MLNGSVMLAQLGRNRQGLWTMPDKGSRVPNGIEEEFRLVTLGSKVSNPGKVEKHGDQT